MRSAWWRSAWTSGESSGRTTSARLPASTPSSAWRTRSSTASRPGSGCGGAGLEPREVEQVAHDPVEPDGLPEDRLGELAPVAGVERELVVGQRAGGGQDRHQWRAQVVADRAQHCRLHRVAPPERFRVERLSRQPLRSSRQPAQCSESSLGLLGAPPRTSRELADDDGRDEEDEQREPVARVRSVKV